MNFLYGTFLIALLALAIPIIIHLFQFRKFKRMEFSSIRFLEEIQKEKKKSNNLKHLLILLLRCLAVTSLVLAFAMPFFSDNNINKSKVGRNAVAIYIDNSFSMESKSTNGNLLNEAIIKAEQVAKSFKESDQFMLQTNDEDLKLRRWVSKNDFLLAIHQIQISPASKPISKVIPAMKEGFSQLENLENITSNSYFISDFQKNTLKNLSSQDLRNIKVSFIPLEASKFGNVYIDSLWIENPVLQVGQQNILKVRLSNSGKQEVDGNTLTLKINKQQKGISNFSIPVGGLVTVELPFTLSQKGVNQLEVSIQDYPISFDDTWFAAFNVPEKIDVLIIKENDDVLPISSAFSKEKAFKVVEKSILNISNSDFKGKKLILLAGVKNLPSGIESVIQTNCNNGANLLIFPSKDGISSNMNGLLSGLSAATFQSAPITTNGFNAQNLDFKHPFFAGVFGKNNEEITLPKIKKYYPFQSLGNSQKLISMAGGESYFLITNCNSGYVFQFPTPLDANYSNIVGSSIFLPILYKSAFYSGKSELASYVINKDESIIIPGSKVEKFGKTLKIEGLEENVKTNFQPGIRNISGNLILSIGSSISKPGFYSLVGNNIESKTDPFTFAYNFNRDESNLEFFTIDELSKANSSVKINVLEANKASFEASLKSLSKGKFVWKYFLILALICLITESLILRFYK